MDSLLLNPKKHNRYYPDDHSREMMLKTIQFFENKGRQSSKPMIGRVSGMPIFWNFRRKKRYLPHY